MPPAGFKRSRALWDNARRPHITRKEAFFHWLRAILYELQPVRWSPSLAQNARHTVRLWGAAAAHAAKQTLPTFFSVVYRFLQNLSLKQWSMLFGLCLYYGFVRFIHHVLDAGPMVVILTALGAIFTVGLGDNENDDGLSAYAVFNRGFQRLLGTMDADQVLAQHLGGAAVGGGAMMIGAVGGARQDEHPQNAPGRAQERPGRRHVPQQPVRPGNEAIAEGQAQGAEVGNNHDHNDENNRARRSGKKARRRNLEQRREMRRQREAARVVALGEMQEGLIGENEDDALAMQLLLEEQLR